MTAVNQRHSQDPQHAQQEQEQDAHQRNNTQHDRVNKGSRQRGAQQGGPRGAKRDDGR